MTDESSYDELAAKALQVEIMQLRAQCDALFACVAVLSMQVGNSPDLLNNLMKGVLDQRIERQLGHIADQNQNLASALSRLLHSMPSKNPDSPKS